jgi:hypothetical protein
MGSSTDVIETQIRIAGRSGSFDRFGSAVIGIVGSIRMKRDRARHHPNPSDAPRPFIIINHLA